VSELAGKSTYFAAGYGGQYLVVVPHLDVVAVTTADVDVLIPSSSSRFGFSRKSSSRLSPVWSHARARRDFVSLLRPGRLGRRDLDAYGSFRDPDPARMRRVGPRGSRCAITSLAGPNFSMMRKRPGSSTTTRSLSGCKWPGLMTRRIGT
jgi:hypothetical protein